MGNTNESSSQPNTNYKDSKFLKMPQGKKFWKDLSKEMIPFWNWSPKPPIITIHGIHALQLPDDVSKAKNLCFKITFFIGFMSIINIFIFLTNDFSNLSQSIFFLVMGVVYFGIYFYMNLQVALRKEYLIQYEEMTESGKLEEVIQSRMSKYQKRMSRKSKVGVNRQSEFGGQKKQQNVMYQDDLGDEPMTEGPKNKRKVSMAPGTVDNEEDALRFTRKRRQSNAKELAAMMTMPE